MVDFSLVYGKYKINIDTNIRQIYIGVPMVLIFQLGSNSSPSLVFKTRFNRSTWVKTCHNLFDLSNPTSRIELGEN
jgi:hypothetical protein